MSSHGEERTWDWPSSRVFIFHCCGTPASATGVHSPWATLAVTSVLWFHRSQSLPVTEPEVELSCQALILSSSLHSCR